MPSIEVPLISPIAQLIIIRAPSSLLILVVADAKGSRTANAQRLRSRGRRSAQPSHRGSPHESPTSFKSDFLRILSERGFIHQISDEAGLDEIFAREIVTAYIGFDATAKSLHAGSLIQIMMLHWMQKTGHRPIALMGGGTSMIGDPSFKDEARKLLSVEQIAENMAGIARCSPKFLTFGDGARPTR